MLTYCAFSAACATAFFRSSSVMTGPFADTGTELSSGGVIVLAECKLGRSKCFIFVVSIVFFNKRHQLVQAEQSGDISGAQNEQRCARNGL